MIDLTKGKIHTIIKKTFPSVKVIDNEEIGPNDISEWDSLEHLNLISEINKEFKINIDFGDILSINKISDIYKVLLKYIDG